MARDFRTQVLQQGQVIQTMEQFALAPANVLAETFPRVGTVLNNTSLLVSGRLHLTAIWLPKNMLITSISYMAAQTGAGTPTNQWFTLLNSSLVHLRSTIDDTTTAWAIRTVKTLALSSTFLTTYTGLHHVGIVVAATTVPTITGIITVTASATAAMEIVPAVNGSSTTGLTGPVADSTVASAITGQISVPWAWLT